MKNILIYITFFCSLTHLYSETNDVIVFVGEKVSILNKQIPHAYLDTVPNVNIDEVITVGEKSLKIKTDTIFMLMPGHKYIDFATYNILKLYGGNYKSKQIKFIVSENSDTSYLTNNKQVLLFVNASNSKACPKDLKYSLRKNQVTDVCLTENDRWASPYSYEYYEFLDNDKIEPHKIKFKEELMFDVSNYTKEEIARRFPKPYYKIKKNSAIAVYGNYVEDLIDAVKN